MTLPHAARLLRSAREHTLDRLNELLTRLDIPHSIAISDIPTAADVAATLGRLHRGEISFDEALDATRI